MAGLGETLLADGALVWPGALVSQKVCLQVTGLLEELAAVWTGVWLDAVVAQYVCDQIVFGGVRLFTHAALPAFQALAHIHAVRLVNLNVDVQSVDASAPWCLPFHLLIPEHALAALVEVPDPVHVSALVAHLIGLEVAADLLASTSGLPHPSVIAFLWHLLNPSLFLRVVSVAGRDLMSCMWVSVRVRVRMRVVVSWWVCGLGLPGAGAAAIVRVRFGGDPVAVWVHQLHVLSRHHAVHHVVAGGQPWSYSLTFNVGACVRVPCRAFAILRGPLPSSFCTTRMHVAVLADVYTQVVAISTNELVSILIIHPLTGGSRRLFGISSVETVRGNSSAEDLILGYESQYSGLCQRQHYHRVCLCPGIHLLVHRLRVTSDQPLGLLLLQNTHKHGNKLRECRSALKVHH